MKLSRRTFIKTGVSGVALVACGGLLNTSKWILHPLEAAPGYQTTSTVTIMPVAVPATSPKLLPNEISKYA